MAGKGGAGALTWLTAGGVVHTLLIAAMSSSRKLETPIERARPSFLICSIAFHASARSVGMRGEWMRSGVSDEQARAKHERRGNAVCAQRVRSERAPDHQWHE